MRLLASCCDFRHEAKIQNCQPAANNELNGSQDGRLYDPVTPTHRLANQQTESRNPKPKAANYCPSRHAKDSGLGFRGSEGLFKSSSFTAKILNPQPRILH